MDFQTVLEDMLEWCEARKVTVVTAAGNYPEKRLHQTLPQSLGTPDNGLITVGGVEMDGSLFLSTTPAEPGHAGSLSVYAPAKNIKVDNDPVEEVHSGTSQATAIVVSHSMHIWRSG